MCLVVPFLPASPAEAGTRVVHVDRRSASCSDAGAGTLVKPYCSISAAVADLRPGVRIDVSAGTYPEAVTVRTSGTRQAPIVIRAEPGERVVIDAIGTGFKLFEVHWVTLSGFIVLDPTAHGIMVAHSSHIVVQDNHVQGSGRTAKNATRSGILVKGSSYVAVLGNISDHNSDAGFAVVGRSTRVRIEGNRSFANARRYQQGAVGIDIQSSGNIVERNIVHDNEDSGIQVFNGAANNVVAHNASYDNGDHGIDVLFSQNSVIAWNTVTGNVTSGITLESGSKGTTIANNIVSRNGAGLRGDIWVDASSTAKTSLGSDLVWQGSGGAAKFIWAGAYYTDLIAFRKATGQEMRGKMADPGFLDAAHGDLRLSAGSQGIDSADSGAPSGGLADIRSHGPIDDPGTPNTGAGPVSYVDRGAFEYTP